MFFELVSLEPTPITGELSHAHPAFARLALTFQTAGGRMASGLPGVDHFFRKDQAWGVKADHCQLLPPEIDASCMFQLRHGRKLGIRRRSLLRPSAYTFGFLFVWSWG